MIEVSRLQKNYGSVQALRDVSFSAKTGETVAIIGPSGSGKSTFIRTLNGLEDFQSGRVVVDGCELKHGADFDRVRRDVGMVFQGFHLFSHLTILENVMLAPLHVLAAPRDRCEREALELLDRVGIANQAHKRPHQLSGGQQQRAAIARALAMKPKVMLFDEPTSSLDPESTAEVLDVIRELARARMTMLIVTHVMGFAREVANRVVFFDHGELVEEGLPGDFFKKPKTARAVDFLSRVLKY